MVSTHMTSRADGSKISLEDLIVMELNSSWRGRLNREIKMDYQEYARYAIKKAWEPLYKRLKEFSNPNEISLQKAVFLVAATIHYIDDPRSINPQTREVLKPYIDHIAEVQQTLANDTNNQAVILSAGLHDTIETLISKGRAANIQDASLKVRSNIDHLAFALGAHEDSIIYEAMKITEKLSKAKGQNYSDYSRSIQNGPFDLVVKANATKFVDSINNNQYNDGMHPLFRIKTILKVYFKVTDFLNAIPAPENVKQYENLAQAKLANYVRESKKFGLEDLAAKQVVGPNSHMHVLLNLAIRECRYLESDLTQLTKNKEIVPIKYFSEFDPASISRKLRKYEAEGLMERPTKPSSEFVFDGMLDSMILEFFLNWKKIEARETPEKYISSFKVRDRIPEINKRYSQVMHLSTLLHRLPDQYMVGLDPRNPHQFPNTAQYLKE